jgi:hypothetical protein
MGSIRTFDLKNIAQAKNITTFIETGTLYGDGVDYALECGFEKIISIEINETLYQQAKNKYATNPRVQILLGNSPDVLKEILPTIKEPVLFWLDAHFPGCDANLASYKSEINLSKKIPLEAELSLISKRGNDDVIIADDLWIYEDWGSSWGTFNEHCKKCGHDITREELVGDKKMIDVFVEMLSQTHKFERVLKDQGFLVFKPK